MPEILTQQGLMLRYFDPMMGSILGSARQNEGVNVLSQARRLGRRRVEVCDWLFCLVSAPGTALREAFIDKRGEAPERFIEAVHSGLDFEPGAGAALPAQLTSRCVGSGVLRMLSVAVDAAKGRGGVIDDCALSLAILDSMDESLKDALEGWAKAEGVQLIKRSLQLRLKPKVVFRFFAPDGSLDPQRLSLSARHFCERLAEDAASMRVKKITCRHVLYTLLSDESSALFGALSASGIDVRKELHASLARELSRPGKKRLADFRLSPDSALASVVQLFERAFSLAEEHGSDRLSEHHVALAFVENYQPEIRRLLPPSRIVEFDNLRSYIAECLSEEDEEPAQRYSITEVEDRIKSAILGQEQAVEKVIPWIKRLRFGLPRDGRPAGVFLFMGPTGTGKTQMAKELARYVFGTEEMLIFIEMGQFQTKESMSGFIGAPPGYVGYGEGLLTNGLRDKPEAVVLFDEIEKAHPQVFDTLLRFADEGMISDPAGPVRDGRRCIIILTTNAGQAALREQLQAHPEVEVSPSELAATLFESGMQELRERGFRPEFLGRVDERITFVPFNRGTCRAIVDKVLERELAKFHGMKGVEIVVGEDVRDFLAALAHERSLDEGARGAPRAVNEHIVTPAIDALSVGEAMSGPRKLMASTVGVGDALKVVLKAVTS